MRLPPVSLLAGLISSGWNQPQKLRVLAISRRRHMGHPIQGMPLDEVSVTTNPRQGMPLDEGKASTTPPNEEIYSLAQSFSGHKKVKRKIVLVIGYLGTNFRGMQIHREAGTRTVESVLEEALFKAGAISNNNYGDLKKIGWSRASRTDKGVHAAKCVVVAKLLVRPHDFDNEGFNNIVRDEFNAVLPSDLQVFSVCRVPKSFRGRPECSYREYEYYFPRSIFEMGHANNNHELRLHNLLARYLGTNSFHNFSSIDERSIEKKKAKDKMRMDRRGNIIQEEPGSPHCDTDQVKILEGREERKSNSKLSHKTDDDAMMCGKHQKKEWGKGEVFEKALRSEMITTVFACQLDEKPILVGNTELLRIFIRGKSFLYHQIRLMVGAAIAEALELVPDGTVEAALKTSYQINFALAPGEGLLLLGQGFTGGSAYGNAAVLDPMELSQLQGTLVDYDERSGNNMASKGRVQSLCQPGDILASEDFKLNTILPEITRAWEAENNHLVEDWIMWAQRKSTFEEFHLALVAAKEKMAVADRSNDLIKCNAYREMAFAKEESVQMKEYFPRGFNTSIMVMFNLIPGPKVQSIQLSLLNRMKSGALPQLATTEELLDCVAREGVESMAREGGFVGCLEGKA
eukprot:9265_1